MKFHYKLALIFFSTLLIGCLLGSLLKGPMDLLVVQSTTFAEMVDYENGMYNYGKIMRRIFMLIAVLLLIFSRKYVYLIPLIRSGLKLSHRWKKELMLGLAIGTVSLLIYGAFTYFAGVQNMENNPRSNREFIAKPLIYLFEACLIGLFEETLFRGFILRGILKDLSITLSVILGSLFYAILHFFSFKVLVNTGSQPLTGFSTLKQFFVPVISEFNLVLPYVIGLFIVGVILSWAYLHTKSLYLPIGLHAGWVFGVKLNSFFLDHNHEMSIWFFGDGHIVTGIFGWIFLIGVLFILKMIVVQNRSEVNVKI